MADTVAVVDKSAVDSKSSGVTLKDSAIDKAASDESAEDRKKRLNISDLPGHNYETEQIMLKRQKSQEKAGEQPYKYEANGYTVEEVEGVNLLASSEEDKNKLWQVTADDFSRTFNTKRDAEIFVETHTLAHATMPATHPSN